MSKTERKTLKEKIVQDRAFRCNQTGKQSSVLLSLSSQEK